MSGIGCQHDCASDTGWGAKSVGTSTVVSDSGTDPDEEASASIRVNSPAPLVWAVLSDFHHVDAWAERVRRVEPVGDIKAGLGAGRRVVVKDAGRIEETITCWEEGRRIGYSVSPIGPIAQSLSLWTIEATDPTACKVSLQLKYKLRRGWINRVLHASIVRPRIAGRLTPILTALKHYVETGEKLRADP